MNEQEFTSEPIGLVPLAPITEVDEPIELVADRFGEAVQLDDVGMRAVPAEVVRQFLTERAEQMARMEKQSRRLQEAHKPSPVGGGVPALEDASPLESLVNGERSYVSPAEEFGQRPKPNFLVEELEAGARNRPPLERRPRPRRLGRTADEDQALDSAQRDHMRRDRVSSSAQLEQNVGGRPLHTVGEAEVYRGGRALLRLIDTQESRVAAELLREHCLDAVLWGSQPTLRLR